MEFSLFIPHPALRFAVECYWIVEGTDIFSSKIIPDGRPELIFHYGDHYQQEISGKLLRQSESLAAGQITRPITISPSGNSGVFGVKFFPTGFWKLFGLKMDLLTNQTLDLRDVLRLNTSSLTQQLAEHNSHASRIAIVEKFLLKKVSARMRCDADVAISMMERCEYQESVTTIARQSKISVRKLQRSFSEVVGVTPKMYQRLLRFNKIFKCLQNPSLTKVEASYLCGYFDQAHFNKDFKQFTEEDPSSYFKSNHAFANFFLNR
jgi:AraC-like DNA-binding protein